MAHPASAIVRIAGAKVTIWSPNTLDEFDVQRLLDDGAPIDTFGVGTKIGVSADAPSLDTAYKLVEYAGRPVMKLSPGKQNCPGPKQVHRGDLREGDVLATRSEPAPNSTTPLLTQAMREGERLGPVEPTAVAAERLSTDLAQLPLEALELKMPRAVRVRVSERLEALTKEVRDLHRPVTAG